MEAFSAATKSIEIAAFYFSLTDGNQWPPSNGKSKANAISIFVSVWKVEISTTL
jgi:hypothetical protein